MPKYQCPECTAVLKRGEPVAAGKRLRCPKCEAVFSPKELPDDEAPAKPAKAPPPMPVAKKVAGIDDDDDGKAYTVLTEKSKDDDKPEMYFGSLRDRFAKSKVGPAMFLTVTASNWLLRLGLFSCVAAVALFIFGVWPLVFCEGTSVRAFIRPRVDIMLYACGMFFCGGVMCAGASKMHTVSNFPMAIIGSLMAIVVYVPTGILIAFTLLMMFGILGLVPSAFAILMSFIGLWCLIVLFNPKVREGFRSRTIEEV